MHDMSRAAATTVAAPVDGAYLHTERICVCFVYREMEQRDGTNWRTDEQDDVLFVCFSPIPCIPFFVFVLLLFSTHTASLLLFLFYFSFQHTYLHFYAFSHSASSSTEHTRFTCLQQILWNKHLWWDTLLTVGHRSRNVEMNFLIS